MADNTFKRYELKYMLDRVRADNERNDKVYAAGPVRTQPDH